MENAMIYLEAKEIADFFVRHLATHVPRYKINCFAQELSNSLLAHSNDHYSLKLDLPGNPAGYYILRDADKVAPLILGSLEKTAISIQEFMMHTPELVLFKTEAAGKLNWIRNNESEMAELCPFEEKNYFEIPSRVFKAAVDQRLKMLSHSQFADMSYPSNFIPLGLIASDKNSKLKYKFRAIGIPVFIFSAEQFNKTTFGSHNIVHYQDSPMEAQEHQPNYEKVDFFAPAWWERIFKSALVKKYADKLKSG
jgi:hypothetical protein